VVLEDVAVGAVAAKVRLCVRFVILGVRIRLVLEYFSWKRTLRGVDSSPNHGGLSFRFILTDVLH